jgi:hypothetical protein
VAMVITGVDRTIRAMKGMAVKDAVKIETGIRRCVGIIGRKAAQYVPKETGALAASKKEEVTGVGFGARGSVSYGGPDAPYAFAVHEIDTAKHAPPTRAHYLRAAVMHTRGTCKAALQREFAVEKSN